MVSLWAVVLPVVAAWLGDPVVRLVRCDEDVRRGRKRPRRASRSGKGSVGGPRGFAIPGTIGGVASHGGVTITCGGELTDDGGTQGLSSASATTVNSSSDGLSFARSTAGGYVAGLDTLTTGGCAEGLVLALPPPRATVRAGCLLPDLQLRVKLRSPAVAGTGWFLPVPPPSTTVRMGCLLPDLRS